MFTKGHKFSTAGGKQPGAGRPTKQVIADEAKATEIARQILARGLGEIIGVMHKVAKGVKRRKFYPPHILEQLLKDKGEPKSFLEENRKNHETR